jgi:hypothetical protein
MTAALSPSEYKALTAKPAKRSKYNSRHVLLDGHRFDSQAEADRYDDLKLFQRIGVVADLVVHPRYGLEVAGVKICTYEADFSYRDEFGNFIVEDVKGVETAVFKIKAKLFKALYGFPITVRRAS